MTMFYGAPPMYFAFVNTPGLEKYDLSSLRMAFSAGGSLARRHSRALQGARWRRDLRRLRAERDGPDALLRARPDR